MIDQNEGTWELRGLIRKRRTRGEHRPDADNSTWMHIFFREKMGSIPETNTPQAFTIYGGTKDAGIDHTEMRAIGSLYYLMPGDDQKRHPLPT